MPSFDAMADNAPAQSKHAWTFMNENDLVQKLQKLGLTLNHPEPALICNECKYALQPSGIRVSKHLAEKHGVPASDRRELATYIDSLHLPDPNLLNGRDDGSEPHPGLLVSKGAACKHCTFRSKNVKLVQRHLTRNHLNTAHKQHWLRDSVRLHVSMQSWTQNGSRTYWIVNAQLAASIRDLDSTAGRSPRRAKRLEVLHEEERRRAQKDKESYDILDTGVYDEAFLGNWMRRTNWTSVFSGVNRLLLVRLAEAPSADGSPLMYGEFEDRRLQSSAEDERRIRSIGAGIDAFFDRCEDTARHTDHSIRCWLRSNLADRPYKAPFQLPIRPSTRSRYRALWRRLVYFWFRLYRLEPAVRQNILRHHFTEEQRIVLDEVWTDPCWTNGPSAMGSDLRLADAAALQSSTRCSSVTSASSWSSESALSIASISSSDSSARQDLEMVPRRLRRASTGTTRVLRDCGKDDDFIDLGLDDWLVGNNSHDSLSCSMPKARGFAEEASGKKSAWDGDLIGVDTTMPDRMADVVGRLSLFMCSEEFIDGQSSTTMLVFFCGVLGISHDGLTFDRPRNYTPKLSAIIHSARLICLEATLPRRPHPHIGWDTRPRTGQLKKLNRMRKRFMCLGCQAPLGELLSLRTYGRAFSRTDGPSFRVRWSNDRQVVSWADGKLCLSDFRCFAQRSIESAETLLDQMMYGSRPMIDLNSLHDDMSAMKHGYSFIQDPRNKLTTKYLELSSEACLSSVNGLMSGESWNSKAVQNYLDQDHELLKQLGLVMHLTGGQAPRSTELFSIECENGPATSRGLYIHDGAICYVTRHSKARRTTNQEFQVARYLSPYTSQILVRYLVYVRPFVAMLRRICVGQSEASRLLFHHPSRSDTPWKADILTKALRVHTQDICGIKIGIQVYRQLSIAITEKHVKRISRPFHLNDDRSAQADMEVAFAWQSGHRPRQRGTSYGIDGAFPDSLQPALLRVYRWTSDQWHRFIDLESLVRPQEARQARAERPTLNRGPGIQQPKRKVTLIDGEIGDRPRKRRFPWNRLIGFSDGLESGHGCHREDIERIYLHGNCASALRYLRTLSGTTLSTVQEVHIERGLLMADDDDNRSYFSELWIHLNTHITLRSVSIVVPDDMITSAKKNQGQYEWFMWKLHEHSVQAFLDGRLDELRFVHNGEHPDEGTSIYEWFNVENYIEKMLMPDNKVLYGIRSTYWKEYHASIDYTEDVRIFRCRRAREAALREIDRQWQQAGLSIKLEIDPSRDGGPVLVVKALRFRG
jgi:hypothetical protein